MERGQRIGLIVAAVVVAAVGIVLIQSAGGDDDPQPAETTTQVTRPGEPGETTAAPEPPPRPQPRVERIRIAGGDVRGGEREIKVKKDEVVRIVVTSDAADEIHLHGYDVYKDVAPGSPARFRVKADAEGQFELEAHDLGHVIIGTLVVEP